MSGLKTATARRATEIAAVLGSLLLAGCVGTPDHRLISLPMPEASPTAEPEPATKREHARILASYGGEYQNARLQAMIGAARPEIPGHHSQFAGDQRFRAAERASLHHARAGCARKRQG